MVQVLSLLLMLRVGLLSLLVEAIASANVRVRLSFVFGSVFATCFAMCRISCELLCQSMATGIDTTSGIVATAPATTTASVRWDDCSFYCDHDLSIELPLLQRLRLRCYSAAAAIASVTAATTALCHCDMPLATCCSSFWLERFFSTCACFSTTSFRSQVVRRAGFLRASCIVMVKDMMKLKV